MQHQTTVTDEQSSTLSRDDADAVLVTQALDVLLKKICGEFFMLLSWEYETLLFTHFPSFWHFRNRPQLLV